MKNPKATLHMANGTDIAIELLPEAAPNTVNSFIYAASHGYLDHHAIERIVPGNWVDVSKGTYPVFGKVISGMDEIRRIAAVKTIPVDFPIPGVEVNKPVDPQVIETVELELYGETYPEPVRVANPKLPKCWPKL